MRITPFNDLVPSVIIESMEKEAPNKLSGKKIFIVEDDDFFRSVLEKKLGETGAVVSAAKNGTDALVAFQAGGFDLIILDLLLPGVDGFDLLKQRQNMSAVSKTPVIVLSNLNDNAQVKSASSLGVKSYLVKAAVSIKEVLAEAERVLGELPTV